MTFSGCFAEWSYYEVKVFVLIMRFNGNNTDIDEARNIVLNWVRRKEHLQQFQKKNLNYKTNQSLCYRFFFHMKLNCNKLTFTLLNHKGKESSIYTLITLCKYTWLHRGVF